MSENYVEAIKEFVSAAYNNGFQAGKDEGYQKGLEDAWEAARKIDGMTGNERHDCFGIAGKAFKVTAFEAIKMIAEYEECKKDDEIKVGDEITSTYSGERGPAVVVRVTRGDVYYVYADGRTSNNPIASDSVKKTGRHFPEVADLLEKMKGGE